MRVLFVCTGNTCRSPMAERLARHHYPQHTWESAGVIPAGGMHPMTRRVLKESGAETGNFASRDVASLDLGSFDAMVLIGRTAQAVAPEPPVNVQTYFWDVADPYEVVGKDNEVLAAYLACREDLEQKIKELVDGF